jgi:primosomal protein N' (replication factor Y)
MRQPGLKPHLGAAPLLGPQPRAAVLLPLPLPAYDYKLAHGCNAPRGTVVSAPLGNRQTVGVVWGDAQGGVGDNRLKEALPLEDDPRLPAGLCDFIDWMAAYTLNPAGSILAMVIRSRSVFAPEVPRTGYIRGDHTPPRMTPARVRVLEAAGDGLARSIPDLAEEAGVSAAVVRGLIAAGALAAVSLPEFLPFALPQPDFAPPSLGEAQAQAATALRADVAAGTFSTSLLDGVTGSGKTEVYFEAVAEALTRGRQVLILLPEIALTVQFLERFKARFGCRPAEWHSDLSQKERRRTWRAVMRGEARVVVGARSALFLPFGALGLIVVDEEHEQAFKQQEGAIYHARDMAVVRARLQQCPIILSSATPSLESHGNALSGRYRHLRLPKRHGAASLPQTRLIDMRVRAQEGETAGTWLSAPLCAALTQTLAAGEQAILFLNRRGYAPLTLCQACGHKMNCPHCAAWLVEHRARKRLVCHHCAYAMAIPAACPHCGEAHSFTACGPGVERVAEEFRSLFPQARMAIASSDTLHGPLETQAAIRAFGRHEIDVLIGTQMIAKGHHFPQLTLVGVIDADLGGADGDPRSRERSFQMLHQVSGRAGRAEKPGLVLIQTRNPQDAVMQALAKGDRDGFYAQERGFRELSGAPPFGRLAAIIVSGHDGEAVRGIAAALGKAAPPAQGVKVWGPAPAFYAMLRGLTRERLLVQTARNVDIQAYLRAWLTLVKVPNAVRVAVDVDPMSFF